MWVNQPNTYVTREELEAIASEVVDLLLRKNRDYGGSWSIQGIAGVLVRLSDKFFRVKHLTDGAEALVAEERVDDTLRDAIGYCLLGLVYLRNKAHGERADE
jgi:hypothetical protein